ncbi:hypothetical protein L202_02853 [Cryptococcus amylolentus CBS 6039]|uniref:[Histone H3]-trimethyl-L-lysine(9) demethylase n=1 Tax=Cryptococcus amylolentus CBS 6039 TaxID=1295533 RepID=A0A1E3HWM3_9TREE|nr:hypothetical protein L202_02853 [Cryptococcus amylolentus CBS 6039]ODN80679.1 hypothetical protein L202_02853 [Cryptococcus amylolentus CBS 6039]
MPSLPTEAVQNLAKSPQAGNATQTASHPIKNGESSTHANGPKDVPAPQVEAATSSDMPRQTQKDGPKYIQPDHFSPMNNNPNGPEVPARGIPNIGDGWLSPEDDPSALRGIPVFKPTMEEFKDFEGYAHKTTAWGQYSGICKIIPPTEWTQSLPPISASTLSSVEIKEPIQQNLIGSGGLFRIANVARNKRRPLTIEEWFDKCQEKKFTGPGPKDLDRTVNRDSKEAIEHRARVKQEIQQEKERKKEENKRRRENKAKKEADAADEESAMNESGKRQDLNRTTFVKQESSLLFPNPTEPESDDPSLAGEPRPFYRTFDYTRDWLAEGTTLEDYTPESCVALERRLWKNLGLGEPSWYGADTEGTLFADKDTPWNVAHLPNLLNRWDLRHLPGVNTPYLYFGMWGASFAWHVEDMDLFSINYIHFGAPKFWYAIPQQQAERFERVLQAYFPEESRACDQFLRHKSFAVSPYRLAKEGLHVNMLQHNQGEFVITYPRGYHAGFNMGFNCAESVNFALESWVELGRRAKACQCVNYSVRIDVDEMLSSEAKRLRGEQELLEAIVEERKKPRKRPSSEDKATPRKKIKSAPSVLDLPIEPPVAPPRPAPAPKKRPPKKVLPLSSPAVETKAVPPRDIRTCPCPCLFCPGSSVEDLLPVWAPPESVKAKWYPRDGPVTVHHSCALPMPGVGIEDMQLADGSVRAFVVGAENVQGARWNLKCASCSDKRMQKMGAKLQCTKGKCPRAFHVSCAHVDASVRLNVWVVEPPPLSTHPSPVNTPEVEDPIKVELLCPQHNPDMKERLEKQKAQALRDKVLSIPLGSKVKIKSEGASLEYVLLAISGQLEQISVQVPAGERSVFPWSSIDLRPSQVKMQENEYARTHTHTRRPDPASTDAPRPSPTPQPALARPLRMDEMLNPTPSGRQRYEDSFKRQSNMPVPVPSSHYIQALAPIRMVHPHPMTCPPSLESYALPSQRHQPRPQSFHDGAQRSTLATGPPPPQTWPRNPPVTSQSGYPGYIHSAITPYHSLPLNGRPSISADPRTSNSAAQDPAAPASQAGPPPPVGSDASGVGKIDLGLSRMQTIMSGLQPLTVPAIHLSGTNGKGSVSALLESVFMAAGLQVGRYNSPHLLEPRDAIRINGIPPSKEKYEEANRIVEGINRGSKLGATSFEIATSAALWLINDLRVDVMIIECGMGGARDATNILPPERTLASALTTVGLDHTNLLGDTIAKITHEKASIAVEGAVFVVGRQMHEEVPHVARGVAEARGARVFDALPTEIHSVRLPPMSLYPFRPPPAIPVRTHLSPIRDLGFSVIDTQMPLPGKHQLDNLSAALAILHALRNDARALDIMPTLGRLSDHIIQRGVFNCHWEGRCSWIDWRDGQRSYPILVDGAHNADSAHALRGYLNSLDVEGPRLPTRFILSLSSSPGKTVESVLAPLLLPGDEVEVVDFTTPVEGMPWIKTVPVEEAAQVASRYVGPQAVVMGGKGVKGVHRALVRARDEGRLPVACGSLYLVADVYRVLQGAR